MSRETPELAFERLLLALERELIDATDEEILAAARELGMNPGMRGSSAFFGVTTPTLRQFEGEQSDARSDAESPCQRLKDDFRQ
ncbi:MAG: hypothetical protein WBW93_17675 [Steroidobacteraceae bacterium]